MALSACACYPFFPLNILPFLLLPTQYPSVPAAPIHCTHILQANQAAASQATEAAAKEADAGSGAGGPASSTAAGGAPFAFGLSAAAAGSSGPASAPAFLFGASAAPAAAPAAPNAAPAPFSTFSVQAAAAPVAPAFNFGGQAPQVSAAVPPASLSFPPAVAAATSLGGFPVVATASSQQQPSTAGFVFGGASAPSSANGFGFGGSGMESGMCWQVYSPVCSVPRCAA